ncbi:MAG TPA: signal peptidase I [Actinomycetes bacterium]|nr:signal peptidase I [Actinomycetes bacterium]
MVPALAAAALGAAVVAAVSAARRAGLEPVVVGGRSMLPTLPPGTLLAVGPAARRLRRGDLVVVRQGTPAGGPEPLEMVKRVVGLPGEHVRLTGDRLEVDGRPVQEPYAGGPAGPPAVFEVRLGPGEHLVLGDHRGASTDGRVFGPVRADQVLAVVRFAYWPPRAWLRARNWRGRDAAK